MSPTPEGHWSDLATKGYVVVRSFLTPEEMNILRQDFEAVHVTGNKNLTIKNVTARLADSFMPKLESVARRAKEHAGVQVDLLTGGDYFATQLGVNEPWHQDHESFFLFQEHFHYLNFWIPIEKPDPARSNLRIVPMDVFEKRAPLAYADVRASGASHCDMQFGRTVVCRDESGARFPLDFDLTDVSLTPALAAGDLLLIRGDVFHTTQDRTTRRVSVSFRMINSKSMVQRKRLLEGGYAKRKMMLLNPGNYCRALQCFRSNGRDEVTVGELIDYLYNRRGNRLGQVAALAEMILAWARTGLSA